MSRKMSHVLCSNSTSIGQFNFHNTPIIFDLYDHIFIDREMNLEVVK